MDNTEHYEKLRNMYMKAKINTLFFDTTQGKIENEKATISLDISDKYLHALGAIHGTIYFRMLDDSAYFAANSVEMNTFLLTSSFHINILRPVNKGRITAVGKLKFKSKNLLVAESTLFNEAGKKLAFGTGNFMKSKIELTEEIGAGCGESL